MENRSVNEASITHHNSSNTSNQQDNGEASDQNYQVMYEVKVNDQVLTETGSPQMASCAAACLPATVLHVAPVQPRVQQPDTKESAHKVEGLKPPEVDVLVKNVGGIEMCKSPPEPLCIAVKMVKNQNPSNEALRQNSNNLLSNDGKDDCITLPYGPCPDAPEGRLTDHSGQSLRSCPDAKMPETSTEPSCTAVKLADQNPSNETLRDNSNVLLSNDGQDGCITLPLGHCPDLPESRLTDHSGQALRSCPEVKMYNSPPESLCISVELAKNQYPSDETPRKKSNILLSNDGKDDWITLPFGPCPDATESRLTDYLGQPLRSCPDIEAPVVVDRAAYQPYEHHLVDQRELPFTTGQHRTGDYQCHKCDHRHPLPDENLD